MQLTANTAPDYGTAAQLRDDLAETMRSVKDTLAMSFQQLNLTLASMNNTLRNMAPSGPASQGFTNIMPSGMGTMLGTTTQPMAGYLANAGMLDLAGFTPKPFNVSSMEFYRQREEELRYRAAPFAFGASMDITKSLGMYGGYKAGGALARGMGWTGLKSFGAVTGVGMLASMGVGMVADAAERESDNYAQDSAMFRRVGARFSGGAMSHQSSQNMASWLNTSGNRELHTTQWDQTRLGTEGYRDLASMGLSAGLFQGQGTDQLKKQIEGAAQVVRFLAGVMGSSDVKEAIQAVIQLKQLGFNPVSNSGFVQGLGKSAFGLGGITGISSQQMMGLGMNIGQNVQSSMGVNGLLGMRYGMHGYANSQMLERSGVLNQADLALMGGHEGAAQKYAMGMAGASTNPAFGGMLTAALMGPNGNLNRTGTIGGGYFGMMGAAAENVMTPGRFAMWQVNQPKLQQQLGMIRSDSDPVLGMIQSAISPIIEASGAKGREERTAMSAMIISKTMGVDLQTAKAMATMAEYPEFTRRREGMERANVRSGENAETRARYTAGHRFGNGIDSIIKPFSNIYADFTEGVHGVNNWLDNATGESAVTRRAEMDQLSSQAFDLDMLRRSPGVARSGPVGPSDTLLQARNRDSYNPFFNSDVRAYADQFERYDRHGKYGEYYDKHVKGISENTSVYSLAKNAGVSKSDLEKDFKRSSFYGKLGGGLEYARSVAGNDASEHDIMQFGAAVESRYSDKKALDKYLGLQEADFSGEDVTQAEKSLGMGAKDIAKMARFSDSSISKFGKVIEAGLTNINSNGNKEDAIAKALEGLSGPEEAAAKQLLKTVNFANFQNMSTTEIKDWLTNAIGKSNSSIVDAQYNFTVEQVWRLGQGDGEKLRKGLIKGGKELTSALESIDVSKSPGLKALREDSKNISDAISSFGENTLISTLSKDQQSKLSKKFGIDITSSEQGMTVGKLGERATSTAVNIAQAGAVDKFEADRKDITSTFVQVGSKNAIAVVIMKPDGDKVLDLNAGARQQISVQGGRPEGDTAVAPESKPNTTPTPTKPAPTTPEWWRKLQ